VIRNVGLPTSCLALALGGCLTQQEAVAPVAAAPPPPPPVERVYEKPGASNEDFQRARARCLMNANMTTGLYDDPLRWTSVYRSCMRADGWVLVAKR
jgi:hypothetical protein